MNLCQVGGCTQEAFVACPVCLEYLCQTHFDDDLPCEDHYKHHKGKLCFSFLDTVSVKSF